MRSETELRTLAIDIKNSKIFHSGLVPPDQQDLLKIIFEPLALFKQKHLAGVEKKGVEIFWEYTDKALDGKGVSGFPIFHTMQVMTGEEIARIKQILVEGKEEE